MIQLCEGNLDSAHLHLVGIVRPSQRDVVCLGLNSGKEGGAEDHAMIDAPPALTPEAFRKGEFARFPVQT